MKTKILAALFLCSAAVFPAYSQKNSDLKAMREEIRAARAEAIREKNEIIRGANMRMAAPTDFWDTDSFGKNVKFLGSLYAGTVYVYRTCDPQTLSDEMGVTLAPDDKCVVHAPGTPMPTVEFYDPAWEITIPGKTVDNVVFPMLNNNPGFDAWNSGIGGSFVTLSYVPTLIIESDALNDPLAINPNTGLPMNGSYATILAGFQTKQFSLEPDAFRSEYTGYASISGRGLSRSYFEALGLPKKVINQLFKKDMKLRFGLRARVIGPVEYAQFYYTYRLLGN